MQVATQRGEQLGSVTEVRRRVRLQLGQVLRDAAACTLDEDRRRLGPDARQVGQRAVSGAPRDIGDRQRVQGVGRATERLDAVRLRQLALEQEGDATQSGDPASDVELRCHGSTVPRRAESGEDAQAAGQLCASAPDSATVPQG